MLEGGQDVPTNDRCVTIQPYFLVKAGDANLSPRALLLKRQIVKKLAAGE